MERPLAVTGFCYITALVVALFLGQASFGGLCVIFLTGFLMSVLVRKWRKKAWIPTACLSGLAAVVMLWGYTNVYVEPLANLKGETAEITGVLCELPYRQNDRYYYRIRTDSIDMPNVIQDTTLLISSRYKIKIEPYDKLKATVRFYSDTEPSQELYSIAKGIMIRGSIDPLKMKTVTKNEEKPIYYYALMTRKYISERINAVLPEREAAFVNAIMTGDKYQLKDEEKQNLRSAGISHIVVVSGFHLAVITQLMLGFFKLVTRRNQRLSSALCIIFVFLYMAVIGFPTPIIRAGVMQIFFLLAATISRKSDPLNILGLSGMIICIINPYAAADISFLMSFASTLGILLLGNRMAVRMIQFLQPKEDKDFLTKFLLYRIVEKIIKAIVNIIAVSLSAYIFIMPIMIVYFKQVAIYAVLTNLMISFAMSILIYAAVFMILAGIVNVWLSIPLICVVQVLSGYILWTAETVADFPFSVIVTAQEFVPFWLIAVMIAGLILFLMKCQRKTVIYYILLTVMSFIVCAVGDSVFKSGSVKISVLDVGNGISCVVSSEGRTYVLSDGGSYYKSHALNEYLSNSCTEKITYMLLLDDKNACTAYAKQLLETYPIETIQVYDEEDYTENIKLLLSDSDVKIDGSVEKVYIDDVKIQTMKEKNCMAVYAKFGTLTILMIEGKTDCKNLPDNWQDTDILIVNGVIENSNLLSAGILAISDEYDSLDKYDEMADGDYGKIDATAGKGDISIRAYRQGQIEVRRENGWLN